MIDVLFSLNLAAILDFFKWRGKNFAAPTLIDRSNRQVESTGRIDRSNRQVESTGRIDRSNRQVDD